jgi:signal transduction histidine kinase
VVFAVWMRVPQPPSGPGLAAVGFRADPEELRRLVAARLAAGTEGLAVRIGEPSPAERFVSLAALPGERRFLRLGLEARDWQARVGKAREPFVFAGALLIGLAAISILAFLVFLRGVRREVALSRLKTEFVAGVSHELKTPLALIRLYGETLLLDRVADPEQRQKYCRVITRESDRLGHLIANVLNFATIEAGRKNYDLKPVDVGAVVREAYEGFRLQLDEAGFSHRLEVAPDLPPARADGEAIAQAVLNLIENAMKYSPAEKSLAVRVAATNGLVKVTVSDRGIGIARDEQARIWEDFYRTREARALGTRGSGLGLSLVRHIVEAHGGRVSLHSAPGEGSAFSIEIPALEPSR